MIAVYMILAAILIPNFIPNTNINPELQSYYEDYMGIVNQYCTKDQYNQPVRLDIDFENLPDPEIGHCEIRINSYYIKLDRSYWLESNEDARRQLMFHELSHCIIDKDHVNDVSNYMFFMTQPLEPTTVRRQVTDDIKDHCEFREVH